MKKRILTVVVILILGYVLAVFCHLFIQRNISRKDDVYTRYCTGYESSCACDSDTYGIYETGFPFISGRDDVLPCGKLATTEQRALNDYSRDDRAAFTMNVLFWSGLIFAAKSAHSAMRKRQS
jgi:hypothetical protein